MAKVSVVVSGVKDSSSADDGDDSDGADADAGGSGGARGVRFTSIYCTYKYTHISDYEY